MGNLVKTLYVNKKSAHTVPKQLPINVRVVLV